MDKFMYNNNNNNVIFERFKEVHKRVAVKLCICHLNLTINQTYLVLFH